MVSNDITLYYNGTLWTHREAKVSNPDLSSSNCSTEAVTKDLNNLGRPETLQNLKDKTIYNNKRVQLPFYLNIHSNMTI